MKNEKRLKQEERNTKMDRREIKEKNLRIKRNLI